MDDINVTPVLADSSTVENIPVRHQRTAKTAADWVRDMRMSPEVNKTTVGVETDRITPDLLMATSSKLLGISRREQDPDPKDSLLFQRFYGPAEYFAEHVLRDGGKVARNLLWKATNKGKVDFIPSGALDQHISDVYYTSKLAQMIDGSSPLETVDASFKTTRVGEGGVADVQSAPDEMRTVQASYFGYLDPVRSAERLKVGLDMYMTKNVLKGSDGKLYQRFINARTGKEELVDSVTASKSVVAAPEMMDADTKSVFALGGRTGVRIVPKDQVDYYLPRADDAYSTASNLVAMPNGVKEMRLLMGCLHPSTPLVTISSKNEITITPAKSIGKNAYGVPGCDNAGKSTGYLIRNSIAKFPQKRKWFKKVVLLSGRSLITSYDHRWPVLRDNALVLVNADKLQPGDQVLRSSFKDLPNRRTFMRGVLVNKDVATLLGCIVRSVTQPEPGKLRIVYQPSQKTFIEAAIKRLKLEGSHFYANAGDKCLAIHDAGFIQWIEKEICIAPEERRVPTVILSACLDIASHFIDAYTANPTQVGIDSNEDMWILDIPSMICRDGLALLLARMQTDTLYRDAVRSNGVSLALKLVEQSPTFGDSIVDEVKVILEVEKVPIMIDIDIDDNMYAAANGIITHNSKYPLQAISLLEREAPLVRNLDEATGKDMPTLVGKYLGARFAKQGGTVTAVRKDRIDVIYDDGTKGHVSLYQNFPMNAKGYITNTPVVKAGQSFKKGDILASSNYTDDKGVAAIGKNLRSGWLSWKGGTYEDAVVLSESAAKALTSRTMYKSAVDLDKTVSLGKKNYMAWKPSEYTKEQLEALDDNGIVKPGAVLRRGDPMILAVQTTEPSPGTLGKRVLTDISETWEHDHPGVVTDVVKTRKGVKVYATVEAPAEIGDKISGHYGNKGIVSCYDSSTYVFTDSGFKLFADLTKADKVATLGKDGIARFEYPSRIVSQWYEGPMYKCKARRADWCVTPNHDMWCADRHSYERKKNPEYRRQNVADIAGRRTFHKVAAKFEDRRQVRDTFILPVENVKQQKDDAFVFSAVDFASLLGIWLAEGHVYAKYGTVIITQKEHDKDRNSATRCRKIEALLTRMGLRWKRYGIKYEIRNRALFSYLRSLGRSATKYIPAAVFDSFPQGAQRALLDWHYMGDGNKTGTTKRAATVSRQLCRDLQRLHILLGDFCTTTDKDVEIDEKEAGIRTSHRNYRRYRITHTDISDLQMHHRRISVTDYAGFVYCVTVSSGVVLTMRGGKPLWCGNSIGPESSSEEQTQNDEEKEYSIQRIVPDAMMPLGEDGKPLDLLFSPLGLVSRTNASMIHEALLGKIARKTGKPYVIPAFYKGDLYDLVESQLKQHHISDTEDLTDPYTGKKIPKVLTGVSYIYKLKHQAESKLSARGTDSYTAEGQPGGGGFTGSKRYGTLESSALVGHNCLTGSTRVVTATGYMPISQIVNNRLSVDVLSYNIEKDLFEYKKVTNWFAKSVSQEDLWQIQTNARAVDGKCHLRGYHHKLVCTKEHRILRPDGTYTEAQYLKKGDLVVNRGQRLMPWQMQIVLGTLMGDGSLSNATNRIGTGTPALSFVHGPTQLWYTDWLYAKLRNICNKEPKVVEHKIGKTGRFNTGTQKRLQTINTYELTCLCDEFYHTVNGKRTKRVPAGIVKRLGWPGIAVWFMDDGSVENYHKDSKAFTLHTCSFTKVECEALCQELSEFTGLPWTVLMKAGKYPILRLRKGPRGIQHTPCHVFAEKLAPYIPEEFRYKLGTFLEPGTVLGTFWEDKAAPSRAVVGEPCVITESAPCLEPPAEGFTVYDITVEDNHNFMVTGIVVSNSFANLLDAKLLRGQSNADFWRSIRTGEIPTIPGEPLVHRKFFAHLTGSGVNVRKTPKGISVFSLSNDDVKELAGPRELKSKDTYEARTFRPIDGGLFGQDLFGPNGDRWAYIQLDEPLPNPVMEEPLARLLRMSTKDFMAVAAGKAEVNGMKSSADIKERLSRINLEAEEKQAQREFKDAPMSKKDAALKRYRDIARMKANEVPPDQYMLDRIPVLPPIYRPVSTHNGLTMVADSNYLYAQMMDARDDMREAKNLPEEYQQQARENLYRSWKELTGMYEPENVKLKNKHVQGLLKWALGNSPKGSAFQRKVLGSTVDTVGRGVIAPDPRLKLNQLGVPVPMALGIFEPFVARAMVKQGYTPVEALKMIKARDKRVMPVLVDVMKHSPVQLNRAPSLHKLNIMGFEPVLVAGHAVKVNPSIVVPFAADFDGDSILNMVEIVIDLNILAKKIERTGISGLTSLEKAVSCLVEHQKKESTMIAKDQRALYATACAPLCELPTVPGSEVRKSDTVTEWDVQEGFYTYTKDPVTGDTVLAPITKVSRHQGLTMLDCTISQCGAFTKVVTASDDHSLITLNPMTLEMEKTKPADAVGRCVPRVRYNAGNDPNICARYMDMGRRVELTYDLGVFIGMMLGDGWVDAVGVVRLACCDHSLQQYILEKYTMEDAPIPMRKNAELFVYPPVEDRFSDKDRARFTFYLPPEMRDSLKSLIGTGAKNKRVPEDCFMASRSHITGILMGLLATDGAVTYSTGNKSRKAATKTIAIHTVSPLLRDGIQELASRIGIRTSATPYKGVNSVETCYAVTLSLEDVAREAKKHPALFRIPMARKQEALEKIVADVLADEGFGTSSNIHVPFPRGLFGEFSYAKVATMCPAVVKARATGHIQRKYALTLADMMEKVDWSQYSVPSYLAKKDRVYRTPKEAETLVKKWIAMVRDEETDWCIVTEVTPSSCTEGWDCTVPGPYTFALFDGTVVQDTANVHAPVSDNARRETYEKMFPERNLISMRNRQILYKPEKEYMQGLYVATRMKKGTGQRPRIFSSVEEARQALRKGIIDIDDPIELRKQ